MTFFGKKTFLYNNSFTLTIFFAVLLLFPQPSGIEKKVVSHRPLTPHKTLQGHPKQTVSELLKTTYRLKKIKFPRFPFQGFLSRTDCTEVIVSSIRAGIKGSEYHYKRKHSMRRMSKTHCSCPATQSCACFSPLCQ